MKELYMLVCPVLYGQKWGLYPIRLFLCSLILELLIYSFLKALTVSELNFPILFSCQQMVQDRFS